VVQAIRRSAVEWQPLGQTPIADTRLLRGAIRFRIEKDGFEPVYLERALTAALELRVVLDDEGSAEDAVHVPADALPVNLSGFNTETLVKLAPFRIDRTEVTNRAFKQFVDAGGYSRSELWPDGFSRVPRFVDSTGKPGPAQWEVGAYPASRADEPVGGVS
jgi:hypothetical protein